MIIFKSHPINGVKMANWREAFDEEQLRRIDQVMSYSSRFGYELESDQELIAVLVTRLKNRDKYVSYLEATQVWWLRKIRERPHRRYTCHLLKRLDYLILWLKGKRPFWNEDGVLSVGHYEPPTHFPQWMYKAVIEAKRRYCWAHWIFDM